MLSPMKRMSTSGRGSDRLWNLNRLIPAIKM